MRFFDGFELQLMHKSDKGPKFGAPLFGVSSPFGDAGSGIQDLEGGASPHVFRPEDSQSTRWNFEHSCWRRRWGGEALANSSFRIQDSGFRVQDSDLRVSQKLGLGIPCQLDLLTSIEKIQNSTIPK